MQVKMLPKKMTKAAAKVWNCRKKTQDLPQLSLVDDLPEPVDKGEELPDQPAEPSEPDPSSEDEDEEDLSRNPWTLLKSRNKSWQREDNPCFYNKSQSDL